VSAEPIVSEDPAGAPPHHETYVCPNCQAETRGEYCPDCGQKRVHEGDLSLAHAWHHLVHELLHFDGRILHSLKLLYLTPGRLTLDYLEGRRARHVHPVRLFLVFFAVFFFASWNITAPEFYKGAKARASVQEKLHKKAEAEGVSYETVVRQVDVRLAAAFKASYVGSVLLNGLCLWALFRKQRPYVAEHMVTALHTACLSITVLLAARLFASQVLGARVLPWEVPPYVHSPLAWYVGYSVARVYGRQPVRIATAVIVAVIGGIAIPALATKWALQSSLP
jgi:hypothetical protein